jgi:hypothetical protein
MNERQCLSPIGGGRRRGGAACQTAPDPRDLQGPRGDRCQPRTVAMALYASALVRSIGPRDHRPRDESPATRNRWTSLPDALLAARSLVPKMVLDRSSRE